MSEPLVSTLGDDPDLAELVDEYVAALAGRMQEIERALAAGDRRRVEVLAHQIVGSAGMHGFQTIGQAARRVEEAAAGGNAELIAATLRELRELSARARAR
jgi:HPt (histidine-containing phosphotransfer) domain-containing protein